MTDYKELIKKMDAERDIARAYGRLQSTPGLEDTAIDQPGTAKTILQVPSIEAGKKKSYEDLSFFEKIVNALELGYAQRNVSQSFGDAVDYLKIAGEGVGHLVKDSELEYMPDYAREALSKALSNPNIQANKEWRKKYEEKARESFYDSVKWQAKLNNYATPKAFIEANEATKGMDFNSESVGKWLDKAGQDSLGVALYLAGTSTGAIAPELADLAVTSAITGGGALPVKATKLISRLGQVYNTLSMAKGSYNNEFGSFLRDRLDELKIDTANEQAVRDFFQQDERAQEILNNAQRRAAVVATFDAVGAGFAPHSLNISNSVRMARDATKLVKEHGLGFGTAMWMSSKSLPGPSSHLARFGQSLENLGIQTSMQAGLGMAGEALGSVASGQKVNVGDVLAEGFGEWAGSFHEVAASMGHHAANYVIEEGNARQAKKINEQLVQLNNAINAIGQQINDNYTVETWANEVGKDKNVFAFAQDLVESGTVEKVRDVNPELADKIVAAAEERRDVAIPVNDVLSIAAKNSDLANSLVYDSRTTIDGMSPRQADKFFEEGKDELVKSMMKMIDDAKPTIQIRDEAQQAANGLKEQLIEAGTDERVAGVQVVPWQAYLVRRATDLGTTPSALMKQMNIRVEDGRVVQRTSFGQEVVDKKALEALFDEYGIAEETRQQIRGSGLSLDEIKDQLHSDYETAFHKAYKTNGKEKAFLKKEKLSLGNLKGFEKDLQDGVDRTTAMENAVLRQRLDNYGVIDEDARASILGAQLPFNKREKLVEKEATKAIYANLNPNVRKLFKALNPTFGELLNLTRQYEADQASATSQSGTELELLKITADGDKGKRKFQFEYKTIPYSFDRDENGKSLPQNSEAWKERVNFIANNMLAELKKIVNRAENDHDPAAIEILGQASWYRSMRGRLREEYGGFGDLLADLLGAMSPNTPVRTNWEYAIDILSRALRGDFDEKLVEIEKWDNARLEAEKALEDHIAKKQAEIADIKNALEKRKAEIAEERGVDPSALKSATLNKDAQYKELSQKLKATPLKDETYDTLLKAKKEASKFPAALKLTKENGSLYGFNTVNAARALMKHWREVKDANPLTETGATSPKAITFSGNLIGYAYRATIDVWAARFLQRLAERPRIASRAETGVTGELHSDGTTTKQFGLGQDVFSKVVQMIKEDPELSQNKTFEDMNDDDLQAVAWFIEKEVWTKAGLTTVDGQGGSFEDEADFEGNPDKQGIKEARSTVNRQSSSPEEKALAKEFLDGSKIIPFRVQVGLSSQTSSDLQGAAHVPTDAEMAELSRRLKAAAYSADPERKYIVAFRANSTVGVYGEAERSFDIELVAREGYNPTALFQEVARIANLSRQDSAIVSRVLRKTETPDFKKHRPGVEIYFQKAMPFESQYVQDMLKKLDEKGVSFYTVGTDADIRGHVRNGKMGNVVGVRFQSVPEFEGDSPLTGKQWADLTDEEIRQAVQARYDEYIDIVEDVRKIEGVTKASVYWYDTTVLFTEDYEDYSNGIQTGNDTARTSGGRVPETTGQGQGSQLVRDGATARPDRRYEALRETRQDSEGRGVRPLHSSSGSWSQRGSQRGEITSDIRNGLARAQAHQRAQEAQSFAQQEVLMQNGWDDSSGSTQPPISAPARRGSYSPMNAKGVTPGTGGVIQLMEKADKSTFLHESAHAWLDMDTTLALSLAEKVDRGEPLTQGEKSFLRNLGGFFRWGTQEGVLNFNITDEQSVLEAVRQWSMFTPDEQRGMHELFARGFESYLMQGSAPVSYMGKAFRRFKSWLMSIYQEATNEPKPISKEVKKLYDLMFASEQQAIQAEEKVGLKKLFSGDQKKLSEFMTPEELAEYEELAQEAEEEARNLLAKAIKTSLRLFGAISKATKKMLLSSYKNRVDEREKAILQEPRYRAVAILQEGIDQGDGTKVRYTINRNSLLSAGVSEEVVDMLEQRGWATDAMGDVDALAVPAAAFAELAGTKDVSDLMSDLVDIENLDQAREEALNQIAVEVEQETGQKFASFTENTADLAVHSDLRNRLLIAEYNALVRRLGGRQLLVSAAREYAAEVIGRMTVSELRPSIFESAEKRCAREAENAFLRGDLEACVEAKRGQVLNHQLARAAREARETYKRGASIARMAKRSKTMHKPYQFVLVRLLDQHSMSNMTREERRIYNAQETETSAAIAGIVKQLEDAGTPIDGLETFINSTKHVNDMTVDEMQNFIEVLSQLSRLGHNVYTQNLTQLKTSVGEVIDEGAKLLHKAADEQGRGYNDDSRIPTTKKEVVKEKFRQFFLGHLKMSTICRIFDQNKDGGFFWNLFIRSANERSTFETAMRQKASLVLQEKFVPVFKKGPDEDPIHIPGFDKPFTHGMRLIVALNWGNESNRQRITGGDPNFTPQAIQTILGSLTEADWKAVEAIWQLFESFKPLIAAKEKRVFGVEPEWVKYEPFTVHTSDGKVLTVSGGYYPVKYDPKGDNKAAIHDAIEAVKQEMQGAFQSATTRRSFTKSRVEKVFMPVRLDFAGLYDGLNDVIHDLAWHEWLIDTKRVLDGVDARQQGLRSVIATRYGSSVAKMFDDWRKDIATGGRDAANTLRLVINCFSKNVGLATMGYSATSAVVQLTGIGYAVPRVGLWGVARAITRFMTNPVRVMREAKGKSEYMRLRNTTQIKEVSQIKNRLDRGKFSIQEHAYCMIQVVQGIVDFITWDGAYAKFLREGYSEADAVAMADQTVDDTQSSGNLHSLSEVERAGFYRALGVFYSWANSALNLTVTEIKSERNRAKMLAHLLWMSGLMPIFESMFRELLSSAGDDDDDDDQKWGKEDPALALIRKPLGEIVEYNMGLFLGLRELSNAAGNFVKGENIFQYKGPAAFGSIASIADTAAAVENNPTSQKAMRSYVSTAGYMFGLPASQLKRTMKGAQAIEQGKVDDAEALQALIFGYTGELDK